MALDLYDQVYIEAQGMLLAENTSISTDLMSDDQDVLTTAKGFAGISPSPDMRTVSCENVVPATTGIEVQMEEWKLNRTQITLRLIFGGSGKSCISKGFFKKVSVSGGVGQTVKVSFEFTGTAAAFS
jgi:hypothetical protein